MKSEKKKVSLAKALKSAVQFISKPFQAAEPEQSKLVKRPRRYTISKPDAESELESAIDKIADEICEFDKKLTDVGGDAAEESQDRSDLVNSNGHEADEQTGLQYNSFHSNAYDSITDIFCSGADALRKFDDFEMIKEIHEKFPAFVAKGLTDAQARTEMLNVINDSKFMKQFLAKYDIDVFYFFRLMYRFYSHLFNATFVKKIQKNLKYKKYVPRKRRTGRKGSMKIRKNKKYDF